MLKNTDYITDVPIILVSAELHTSGDNTMGKLCMSSSSLTLTIAVECMILMVITG